MRSSTPSLEPVEAFAHVVNEHRWLAVSACCWDLVGPRASLGTKYEAHLLLPNVDVIALDSLLLHARALIDFYTNKSSRGATDIVLNNFNHTIDSWLQTRLRGYRRPIEVHLLHLTNWRDRFYRLAYSVDLDTHRRDWNREASKFVNLLHRSLRSAANRSGEWQEPFKELYKASMKRYRDKGYKWPKHLSELADIINYVESLTPK